jgi:hypothetical protein
MGSIPQADLLAIVTKALERRWKPSLTGIGEQ